jgi:hypothetical protein
MASVPRCRSTTRTENLGITQVPKLPWRTRTRSSGAHYSPNAEPPPPTRTRCGTLRHSRSHTRGIGPYRRVWHGRHGGALYGRSVWSDASVQHTARSTFQRGRRPGWEQSFDDRDSDADSDVERPALVADLAWPRCYGPRPPASTSSSSARPVQASRRPCGRPRVRCRRPRAWCILTRQSCCPSLRPSWPAPSATRRTRSTHSAHCAPGCRGCPRKRPIPSSGRSPWPHGSRSRTRSRRPRRCTGPSTCGRRHS